MAANGTSFIASLLHNIGEQQKKAPPKEIRNEDWRPPRPATSMGIKTGYPTTGSQGGYSHFTQNGPK